MVVVLGLLYLVCGVKYTVARMDAMRFGKSVVFDDLVTWMLLVGVCSIAFMVWISYALWQTINAVRIKQEKGKVKMYSQLHRSLCIFALLGWAFWLVDLGARYETMGFPWRWLFFIDAFWDLFYFAIVFRVALIWRPTETSSKKYVSQGLETTTTSYHFASTPFLNPLIIMLRVSHWIWWHYPPPIVIRVCVCNTCSIRYLPLREFGFYILIAQSGLTKV